MSQNQTCFRCDGLGEVYEFESGFDEKSLNVKDVKEKE